jgi:uncharacterized membrane protein (UPF0127 family)
MNVLLKKNNQLIASKMRKADNAISRLFGLMFMKRMDDFDALWLTPCNSIHTCFMKFPIDVLFIDGQMKIVFIKRNLRPWRFTRFFLRARSVLEMAAGTLPDDINIGDEVVCSN